MEKFHQPPALDQADIQCQGHEHCPITGGPPVSDKCIFAAALCSIDTGLMIGQPSTGSYLYMNSYAQHVYDEIPDALELSDLIGSTPGTLGETEIGVVESSHQVFRHVIRSRGKVIGLTLYLTGEDMAIVSLKDITQESYFTETLRNPSPDGEVLMRIFAQLRHELGNPLNSIKVTLQVLRENLDIFGKNKVNAYIARTIDEVGRLEKLLASMREFTRHDLLEIGCVDLREVLGTFKGLVDNECREQQMTLTVEVGEDACLVRADSRALQQVLHNLWRNAIQAKVEADGHVVIRSRRGERNGTVKIEVQDDGKGIPLPELSMVFKPMFTTKTEGSGLGLAMVERLITRMGGSVSVSSEEDRYTRFDIILRDGAEV